MIEFDAEGMPRNPRGRTGMRGRGHLYRWGPNHASDPVVVRCKPLGNYEILTKQVCVANPLMSSSYALPPH